MAAEPDDLDLVKRWRTGDEDAAKLIVDNYIAQLITLARRHLSQKLAGRVDAEDIVQSVFRTFFWRVKEGQFNFAEQDDMLKLLVRITLNKTLRQVARHRAAKRNPGMEAPLDDEGERIKELLDSAPSPEVAVAFVDQLEHLLGRVPPLARQILELRLQGHSNDDICKMLGIKHDRQIRRALEHIKMVAQNEGLTEKAGE